MRLATILLILLLIIVNYGCTNTAALESKTKSVKEDLSQVATIGTRIGNMPPDFTVVTTDGKAIRLSDFAEQKKPVIVYFMATWCPYCAEDYQALSKVYPDYEKNISFLSISLDLSEDLNLLREYKKKYPKLQNTMFASGQASILADYSITKTTTKYAIARNGAILHAAIGVFSEGQWNALLEELSK